MPSCIVRNKVHESVTNVLRVFKYKKGIHCRHGSQQPSRIYLHPDEDEPITQGSGANTAAYRHMFDVTVINWTNVAQ